jgi:hypothetical protein
MGVRQGSTTFDGQYGYKQPIHSASAGWVDTPNTGTGFYKGGHAIDPTKGQNQIDAITGGNTQGLSQDYLAGLATAALSNGQAPTTPSPTSPQNNGGKGVMDALLAQYQQRPFDQLLIQLMNNTHSAQNQGAQALANLQQQIQATQNPYANMHFADANATANPLAAYMQASGANTSQVDAYRTMLQQLQQNAINADANRASALSTSFENDRGQRLLNAQTEQAGFLQQLQQQLLSQQNNVAMQDQKRKNDLALQMAQIAMKYGLPMPKGM